MPFPPARVRLARILFAIISVLVVLFLFHRRPSPSPFSMTTVPLTVDAEVPRRALGGKTIVSLGNNARHPTRMRLGRDNSLYVLDAERQVAIKLNTRGEVIWKADLRGQCGCGFCIDLNTGPDGAVFVLDMKNNSLCQLGEDGAVQDQLKLPKSDVVVSFAISPPLLAVNSLSGKEVVSLYQLEGNTPIEIPVSIAGKEGEPRQRAAQVLRLRDRWLVSYRYRNRLELYDDGGRMIAAYERKGLPFNAKAWDKLNALCRDCTVLSDSELLCLLSGKEEMSETLLEHVDLSKRQTRMFSLPGVFNSLAVATDRTVFVLSTEAKEIWSLSWP